MVTVHTKFKTRWVDTGSPFRVMYMFLNKTELMTAQNCECSKCHSIVCFKMVNFML